MDPQARELRFFPCPLSLSLSRCLCFTCNYLGYLQMITRHHVHGPSKQPGEGEMCSGGSRCVARCVTRIEHLHMMLQHITMLHVPR